jgi:hypothetical protein
MMNVIRSIIHPKVECDVEDSRKEVFRLKEELESTIAVSDSDISSRHSAIVATAVQIRGALSGRDVPLTNMEKVELMKAINRAKVRLFLSGTEEGLRTFRILDTIANDVTRRL